MDRHQRAVGQPGAHAARRRARERSRGAALVEVAIIFPLLFLLLFGIMEVGWLLKTYSSASQLVAIGARTGSVAGNVAMADQTILERLASELAGFDQGQIEFIVIWRADGPGDTVPPACRALGAGGVNLGSVGVDGLCNVYREPQTPTDGAFDKARGRGPNPDPAAYFGCETASEPGRLDCMWNPGEREVAISPRVLPSGCGARSPDYLGVYVQVRHRFLVGILGDTATITDQAITLLEPDTYGCGAST